MKIQTPKTIGLKRRRTIIVIFSCIMLIFNSVTFRIVLPAEASSTVDPEFGPACVTVCGNGSIENGEQCDDGNMVGNDGCSTSCQNECILELIKTDSPDPVAPGDVLTYQLNLKNIGTADCTGGGVELKDTFDPMTTYVNASIEPTVVTATDLVWNFGVLAPGDYRQIDLTMTVASSTACGVELANRAQYFSNETGWSAETVETTDIACNTVCGDGEQTSGEECDEGISNGVLCTAPYGSNCSYCAADCTVKNLDGPFCGDNIINGNEACDGQDGMDPGKVCAANCTISEELCRVNLDVIFIMDRSGSMSYETPTRIFQAKNAAKSFIDRLGADDQSGLVSFSNTATLDKSLSDNHAGTKTAVSSLIANGATNIDDGIALGIGQFSANGDSQAVKIEILLTDGKANKPNGPGYDEYPADVDYAIVKALEAASSDIKIYTIGLGTDVNEAMLKQIASSTHGEYHFAPTADDLGSIFNQIAFDVCQYGSIGGCKYNDTNNDSDISGEPKLSGWKINLTGTATSSQQTDVNGCYLFNGLVPGTYTVSEDQNQSTAYVQTYPAASAYAFTLARGENKTNADFGNYLANCGNSIIDPGTNETCDNGQSNGSACIPAYGSSCNYCSASCQETTLTGPYCGDAVKNGTEQCDGTDGVTIGYFCNAQCTLEQIPSETGSIKACKYEDQDGNATTTTDRAPLASWIISIANGLATTTQATDQAGCTTFINLPIGQYTVAEAMPAGWYALEPQSGSANIGVVANQQAQVNFNNSRLSSISGFELHDLDGLASTTGDRTPLSGWVIRLLAGGAQGTELATTSSAINGFYIFDNLLPGAYSLAQILLPGWLNLELPLAVINLLNGTSSPNNNFVNTYIATGTPQRDLAVTKTVDSTAPNAGDTLIYTIVVYNHGTATATNVTATDTLPVDLTLVSATSTSGSYATSTWNIPVLAVGASTTLIITATVNQGTAGKTITNTVIVAESGVTDPTPADNTASAASVVKTPVCTSNCGGGGGGSTPFFLLQAGTGNSTTPLINSPSLAISKKTDKTNVFAGTKKIGYSITITNNGLATANDVLITDTLPAGLVYTDSSTTVKSWNVGTLAAGEIKTYTYLVDVLLAAPTDVYANTAVATASNSSSVSAKAELNVRAPEILGVKELPSTGFDLGEAFMLLLALAAAILISRWAHYVKSTLK